MHKKLLKSVRWHVYFFCSLVSCFTVAADITAVQKESEKANQLFDDIFMEEVMLSPIYQTYLGIKKDYGQWDTVGEAADKARLARQKQQQKRLQLLDQTLLDEQTALSYRLLVKSLQDDIDSYAFRLHNYPVNQMFGVQSGAPSLLINQHLITNREDAKAYISRLQQLPVYFDQVIESIKQRESAGIMAPKFVYQYVIADSRHIIRGQPFDDSDKPSTLLKDFTTKVAALSLDEKSEKALIDQAVHALKTQVKPAYERLIHLMQSQEKRATDDAGVWKFPEGKAFYQHALEKTTTTTLTAEEIHRLGVQEVARIHNEMRQLMKRVNFKGDLQAFFAFMRNDKQFYLANTPSGKAQYIETAKKKLAAMEKRLPDVFNVLPKADLLIKPVEPFREKSAGIAFYQQPAPDGSRPGTYYINLYDMQELPIYELEALAFHEALPGHHMQISIAMELDDLPKFRRFARYTAYVEGWGLYSEFLPKEMGFYQDPYSDFGRLSMELWRACRLVVDTGIHAKKWSREKAIAYLQTNTPSAKGNAVKAIERYIVMPSQATAYKVGMLKILALREKAKSALGSQFDLRDYHDVVLKNGPVPLYILEEEVDRWIDDTNKP